MIEYRHELLQDAVLTIGIVTELWTRIAAGATTVTMLSRTTLNAATESPNFILGIKK